MILRKKENFILATMTNNYYILQTESAPEPQYCYSLKSASVVNYTPQQTNKQTNKYVFHIGKLK